MSKLSDFVGGSGGLEIGQIILSSDSASFTGFLKLDGSTVLSSAYPDLVSWVFSGPTKNEFTVSNILQTSSGETVVFNDIAYGNALYVIVGGSGTILTSPDGITWTSRSSGTNDIFYTVTHGNGLYVASADNTGGVYTSADGISWTKQATLFDLLRGACYGGVIYILVGDGGSIHSSSDGSTWTSRSSGTTNRLRCVVYGDGLYVAAGFSGTIVTSPDGITWTSRSSGTTSEIQDITYGGGLYVAVGDPSAILKSSDGVNWSTTPVSISVASVAYSNGRFVAGGDGILLTSEDGSVWNEIIIDGATDYLRGAAANNGIFVLCGDAGETIKAEFPTDEILLKEYSGSAFTGFIKAEA